MTYKLIHMYLKPGEKFNYKLTANIFKEFSDRLKNPDIKYLHFNHYHTQEDPRYRITVRFEFEDTNSDKESTLVADDLLRQGIIQSYTFKGDQTVKKTVKIASRFASMCVNELITNHKKILEIYQKDNEKSFHLTIYFFKQLLEKIGYKFFATWAALGPYEYTKADQKVVNEFVEACYKYAPTDKSVYPDPDFLERFIHLYLNCALLPGNLEGKIWMAIIISNTLEIIAKTYKANKK